MPVDSGKYRELMTGLSDRVKLIAVSKTQSVEDIRELYGLGQRDFGENYVQELVDKQGQLPGDIRWHFIGHLQSNKVKYIAPFVHLIQGVDSYKLLKEIDKQAQKNERVIDCLLQVHIAREETKFGFDDEELDALIVDANIPNTTIPQAAASDPSSPRALKTDGLNVLKNVRVIGLMGMASFSDDPGQVRKEFRFLKFLFDKYSARLNTARLSAITTESTGKGPAREGLTGEKSAEGSIGEKSVEGSIGEKSVEGSIGEKSVEGSIGEGSEKSLFRILSMGMSGDYQTAIEEGSTMIRVGSLIFGERNYSPLG